MYIIRHALQGRGRGVRGQAAEGRVRGHVRVRGMAIPSPRPPGCCERRCIPHIFGQ